MVLQGCASFPEGLALLRGLDGACRGCLVGAVPFGCLVSGTLQVQPLHAAARGGAQSSRSELVLGNCLGKRSMTKPANRTLFRHSAWGIAVQCLSLLQQHLWMGCVVSK